jgi:hypothetical protein
VSFQIPGLRCHGFDFDPWITSSFLYPLRNTTIESISELKRPSHEQPFPLKIADERGFFQRQSGHLLQKSGHPERVKADSLVGEKASELLSLPPGIEKVDILVAKLLE